MRDLRVLELARRHLLDVSREYVDVLHGLLEHELQSVHVVDGLVVHREASDFVQLLLPLLERLPARLDRNRRSRCRSHSAR